MGRPRKKRYLEPDDLARELEKSRPPSPPTPELCRMLRQIAEHLCGDSRFVGYPKEMHEDMCSAALEKCLKNVKNWDPSKGGCFHYFTRCCELSFFDSLKSHYKQVNIRREATLRAAAELEQTSPLLAQRIREKLEREDE